MPCISRNPHSSLPLPERAENIHAVHWMWNKPTIYQPWADIKCEVITTRISRSLGDKTKDPQQHQNLPSTWIQRNREIFGAVKHLFEKIWGH
ncbi:hypothetical protein AVEN_83951-1 [Araneus ventricosus]|uniref:Uncharacterized protein n=1 Tax=Araneus ventricosus TaxID=182803 RepID=A0A4Y2BSL7_ARAVE|nr:hypothetical protein AVEN_83951-1 [Araneus ventricosus]